MAKWEYLRVHVLYDSHLDYLRGIASKILSNEKTVVENDRVWVHNYLNQFGKDSWELVNVHNMGLAEIYHFKRTLE
jgi:hypothetical protein